MEIQIKQQNRRSLSMRITAAGDVVVSIPHWMKPTNRKVQKFIKEGLAKLEPHLPDERPQRLHTDDEIRVLVRKWSDAMGADVGRVQIREMTRKWGSCSSRRNITLNASLCYLPLHLVEYVIVHELAHLFIFDHSPAFWAKIGEFLPDYATSERELQMYRV
jgi:predicted metal-dependent hydrolase